MTNQINIADLYLSYILRFPCQHRILSSGLCCMFFSFYFSFVNIIIIEKKISKKFVVTTFANNVAPAKSSFTKKIESTLYFLKSIFPNFQNKLLQIVWLFLVMLKWPTWNCIEKSPTMFVFETFSKFSSKSFPRRSLWPNTSAATLRNQVTRNNLR